VGEVFESLVTKLGKLLDVRKVREKEEGECRVLQNMKEGGTATRGTSQADGDGMSETPKPKSEAPDDDDDNNPNYEEEENENDGQGEDDDDAEGDEDDDGGDVNLDDLDAEGEDESSVQQSRATSQGAMGQGHKRSASVFSQGSQQSSKRARK
jgi:DNA methyltransferase 1-associated protein 1